jgi:hypothetical protein
VFEIGAISAGRSKSAASCSPGSLWAGDNNERFKIVSGLWLFHTGRGKIHRALEFSDELFRADVPADVEKGGAALLALSR